MPTKTVLFTDQNLAEGAVLAIKHRLYVHGWSLFPILKHFQQEGAGEAKDELSLVMVDDVPVAVGVYQYRWRQVMCFVRAAARRQGFGSMAIGARTFSRRSAYGDEGTPGPAGFWAANRVDVRMRRI